MNFKDIVNDYIENEKDYIKSELDICGYGKSELNDLSYLENLSEEDIDKIANMVIDDDELNDKIHETIHYYLYHNQNYIKESKGGLYE